MESQDKLYQHVKTGEIKPLPLNVYKVVKRNWRPVSETKKPEPIEETQESTQDNSSELTKEDLQAQYESLTGNKPDGRWSIAKLQEKIEETKGTK
jgi:hypothetical protein